MAIAAIHSSWALGSKKGKICLTLLRIISMGLRSGQMGGRKPDLDACGLQQSKGLVVLVGREVVHHHDVSDLESGKQHLTQISAKDLCVGGSVDGHIHCRSIQAHRADHGCRAPVAMRTGKVQLFTALALVPQPCCHGGFGCRFVQENKSSRVYARLLAVPTRPRLGDVLALLFAGMESLYMTVPSSPKRSGWPAACSPAPKLCAIPPESFRASGLAVPAPAAVTFQNLEFTPAEVLRVAKWSKGFGMPPQLEELFDHAHSYPKALGHLFSSEVFLVVGGQNSFPQLRRKCHHRNLCISSTNRQHY